MGGQDGHPTLPRPHDFFISVRRIFYNSSIARPVEIYDLQVGKGGNRIWAILDDAAIRSSSKLDGDQQVVGSQVAINKMAFFKCFNYFVKGFFDVVLTSSGNLLELVFKVKKRYPACRIILKVGEGIPSIDTLL